jgi:TRAP-type C4-dicarboxylate transport system permease small subunit
VNAIVQLIERVARWGAYAAAFLILAMSLWITYDVLGRNLFGIASPWAFDLSEYSLVWMTFLAAPWILLRDGHVRIEILVDVLGKPAQRVLGIVVSLIGFAACAILTWRTGIAAIEYYQNTVMMPRIWHIPRIWPYCILPIGGLMLSLTFIARLALYIGNSDPEGALKAQHNSPDGASGSRQA